MICLGFGIGNMLFKWKFLLQSCWTKVKGLYIIAQYVPFSIIAMNLYLSFVSNEIPNKCQILSDIHSCFFVLRTYTLWDSNRIMPVVMLSTLLAIIVACIGIRFTSISTSHFTISVIPGIPGCYWSSDSFLIFMLFVLLFVFALGMLPETGSSWRTAKGPLHAILLKHNIFYYACGLFLTAVNVLVPLLHSYVHKQ
ncbi:hypothetical protein EDB19DRAFT_1832696 [Suillus lakei]|nr:hypothetical protein EDB19DRAFT_1832696 [Suillus lakei]